MQVPSILKTAAHLQILVELAELQDQEVGDGTTSVVIFAVELLKRANELVKNKIHPTSIISGYRLAMREVGHDCHHLLKTLICVSLILSLLISFCEHEYHHVQEVGCHFPEHRTMSALCTSCVQALAILIWQ